MKGLFQCPPRASPWAKSFCPFRACCLCPLPWAKSFCPFRACCLCPLPWAKSFCPFRACCLCPLPWAMSFCPFTGRADCVHCPGLRAFGLSTRSNRTVRYSLPSPLAKIKPKYSSQLKVLVAACSSLHSAGVQPSLVLKTRYR